MADLELQVRDYAGGLDLGPAIDPAEIVGPDPAVRPPTPRSGRRLFLVAAAVLVVVVLGAAVVALRSRGIEEPAPPAGPAGVPTSWERIGEIDGAQPFAMAASDRGIVLVGYGAWWSADGSRWERAGVEGIDDVNSLSPGSLADVIATADGFLAVGTDGSRQPAVWRSPDGRSWQRVGDPDPQLPPEWIPAGLSTPYGSIAAVSTTRDGLTAVGRAFAGTFSGDALVSPEPSRPAVWTSPDGNVWTRSGLPGGPGILGGKGELVDVTPPGDVVGDAVAVGTDGDQSFVWELRLTNWTLIGSFPGQATTVARVDGRLVAAGWRPGTGTQQVATIWSSPDGRGTWSVVHEEPAADLSTFTELATDGDLLLALGHSGPGELDTHAVLLSSSDGTTWSPLPAVGTDPVVCAENRSGSPDCPAVSSSPVSATDADGQLLLAVQETVTDGPDVEDRGITRLRTAIHRAVVEDDAGPETTPATEPLRARLELPGTTLDNGTTVDATVVVQNDTGRPVEATRCGSLYVAELHGETYAQRFGEALCGGTIHILPVGESRWPVRLNVFSFECAVPVCRPDGRPPPLPTGAYAVVVTAPGEAPIPEPVTIQVE